MTPDLLDRLSGSFERLQTRRLEKFALVGEVEGGDIFTEVQGRGWGSGSTLSTANIEDLISSIATLGLLQPIQLEKMPDGRHRLVAGERRLRAMRYGSINDPGNPHFRTLSAVVVDGPLSEEEKRRWQLIENLARQDLKPGELAAALLYERAGMLAEKLTQRGLDPSDGLRLDDPIERWDALSKQRVEAGLNVGVSWPELISFLGLAVAPRTAEQLVRAFRSMPAEISSEMDANDISVASRTEWVRLARRGRQEAADEIWEALKKRGRPDLLTRSCREAIEHPTAPVDEVVELAEAANCRRKPEDDHAGEEPLRTTVDPELVSTANTTLETLNAALRAGATLPDEYAGGSLMLRLRELSGYLEDKDQAAA